MLSTSSFQATGCLNEPTSTLFHSHLNNTIQTLESTDLIQVAISWLMVHGGYLTLLGGPATVATVVFLARIQWLKTNSLPHAFGRTNWIYWPTQLFIGIGCTILVGLAYTLIINKVHFNGMLPSVVLMVLAWATAITLNKFEHRYSVRSSDALFMYFVITIVTSAITIFIMHLDMASNDMNSRELSEPASAVVVYRFWTTFIIAISVGFFVEALPRDQTKVQRLARENSVISDQELSNLFSRISYSHFQKTVSLGAKRPLTGGDLHHITPANMMTEVHFKRISKSWEEEVAESVVAKRPPWYLIRFINDYAEAVRTEVEPPPRRIGFVIAGMMAFFSMITTVCLSISYQGNMDLGISGRAATVAMIYRKAMKLSPHARQQCSLGDITNLMSVDAERWIEAGRYMPPLVTVPLELIFAVVLLYRLLGWPIIAGLSMFLIVIPTQAKLGKMMNTLQESYLRWMDSRIRLMAEVLSNIKIVKLYCWETPFRNKIDAARSRELVGLKSLVIIRSFLSIVYSSMTMLIALVTFGVYSVAGGPNMTPGAMTPEVIFVSIAIFNLMNRPLGLISQMIFRSIAVSVSMGRIQEFLLKEEIDSDAVQKFSRQEQPLDPDSSRPLALVIDQGTFSWEKARVPSTLEENERQPILSAPHNSLYATKPVLLDINLKIHDGSLTAIVGRIGQGKSSLLNAIMGEMYKLHGAVSVYGDMAYVPQQAWIINASVRDNILLGKPFDQEKYKRIVSAAGLVPDLQVLPAGDQTEIGERGINLSGGQKQRVSLARAAYQDADVYLFDDPLSAVDAHVDQHLWQNLIGPEGLLKNKTRLLVTHGIHHLEHVDNIIFLRDGQIAEHGEYHELMEAHRTFYQLITEFSTSRKNPQRKKKQSPTGSNSQYGAVSMSKSNDAEVRQEGCDEYDSDSNEIETIVEGTNEKEDRPRRRELIADEKMEDGKVGWGVLRTYLKAASYRNVFICVLFVVVAQVAQISTNFWLRYWMKDAEERKREDQQPRPVAFYLLGYGSLVFLYMFLDVTVSYITWVACGLRASKVIHNQLLTHVLRLPMSFFDTTPMGRVINRFSSDISSIDDKLPSEINNFFVFFALIVGTLAVIAYSTPLFLIAVPPLAAAYLVVQDYFIRSSSSLKRMASVSKSPLYQHFSESLAGVSSIQTISGLRDQLTRKNDDIADDIIIRHYAYSLDNRWLQIRLETLGVATVFIAASLAVSSAGVLDASLVGLSLSYSSNMIIFINYFVRSVSEMQNLLVSVERTQEYVEKPTEAPMETSTYRLEGWPRHGRVVFKNYSARYREGLDLVVKDISFEIQPSEKVGIVGRTGAGKSSLTLALFRIIEAADSFWALASDPTTEHMTADDIIAIRERRQKLSGSSDNTLCQESGGSIEIDGIDISTMGLRELRQHLAIIPQDPTIFAGTVRDNLDPFEEHSDLELWEALERAHLKQYVASLEGGLMFEMTQNGDNFSVGQRSLICLARAILRKTKVLILDEATAAVDVETDDLIQKTIRREFKDRTILTIAHRIKTIMDSDKVLVLDKGRVQEFDPPSELLGRETSLFKQLAHQAGIVEDQTITS
ncbi:hypothetical protein BGW38_002777 [Lunasporangiospora selenospora]|uniref:P-loop containing nucleoside triphosphate hydrolase protein n=1 Tax=Lunasporangiospora selenospora TaxID=979761 RepID=A0A9P6G591_9FUNG|nr:hypothetical protein BGW38_002777 [Lunasporangiospora selenospora]